MWRKYDLRRLKKAVGIVKVLAHYDLASNLRQRQGELVGPCPLPDHGGDRSNHTAFWVNPAKGVWHCHSHCGGGDVVELVRVMVGGDYAAAARALGQIEDGSSAACRRARSATSAPPSTSTFTPYTKALQLKPDHHFLQARGIRPPTARAFEAGWWPLAGFLEGCIGVRLHDLHGRPLGYAGRRVDRDKALCLGKWKLPRCLPKADLLFNWHRARPHLSQGVVLVEGPFDAMRLWQVGLRSVVALLGKSLSPAQRALVLSAPKCVVMLDGDDAGRDGARRLAAALTPHPTQLVGLPDGLDPADLNQEELRHLVTSFFS